MCARTHARTHTGRQNTPPGLASAFNYQTDRGEIKSLTHQAGKGEQGSQAEPEARAHTYRLSSRAGDRPRCTENVKT